MTTPRLITMAWMWVVTLLLIANSNIASGFSWRSDPKERPLQRPEDSPRRIDLGSGMKASQLLQAASKQPSIYEFALLELQQLESERVCHQTAARLLVNNCQLLEGKDDATILTDSGRQVRDFVDAYAASLAICDLERGSFVIPGECASFRESTLTYLSLGNHANLHVSTKEIDGCLSALATSDSAWNTWISYRHKALRFCEAARADNQKSQHILLFQRLTKIMSQTADEVDAKFEQQMSDLDNRAQMTSDRIDQLSPQLDHLRNGIDFAESLITGRLGQALMASTDTINAGIENAMNLQRILEVMITGALKANAEAAAVHEDSLQLVTRRAESAIGTVMTAMAAAVASASTLQNQIELSRLQTAELEHRQDNLEQGMQRLGAITENLSNQYDDHTKLLYRAQNMTNNILGTLEDVAESATRVEGAFMGKSSTASWWPYIWCPAASLVMGSYGLAPSMVRNLGLVALGEVAGFLVSSIHSISSDLFAPAPLRSTPNYMPEVNVTQS